MIIGFTGTREGMSAAQQETTYYLFDYYFTELLGGELHHGGCVGADTQAHLYTLDNIRKIRVVVHPPTNKSQYMSVIREPKGGLVILPPDEYLNRNKAIVEACGLLIATPEGFEEVTRSGTWSTYRYARKIRKPRICVFPDGTYKEEGFDAKSPRVQRR